MASGRLIGCPLLSRRAVLLGMEDADLLSQYISLLNSEGPDGSGPRSFEREHKDNARLQALIRSTKTVQDLFDRHLLP